MDHSHGEGTRAGARGKGRREEVANRAQRSAILAAINAVPDYAKLVAVDFDRHLSSFERLTVDTPRRLSGQMSGEQFARHAELLRAVDGLTAAAIDRGQLGLLAGEG